MREETYGAETAKWVRPLSEKLTAAAAAKVRGHAEETRGPHVCLGPSAWHVLLTFQRPSVCLSWRPLKSGAEILSPASRFACRKLWCAGVKEIGFPIWPTETFLLLTTVHCKFLWKHRKLFLITKLKRKSGRRQQSGGKVETHTFEKETKQQQKSLRVRFQVQREEKGAPKKKKSVQQTYTHKQKCTK